MMNQQPNRLAPFTEQPCTDNLVCRWVDFLFYDIGLRLDLDAEKCGQDYRDAGGGPFFTAAEIETYNAVMAAAFRLKPELLKEMIRANRGAEEFERRCKNEPGYYEALCGLDGTDDFDVG